MVEELKYDEDTLRKVYEAIDKATGMPARSVDVVIELRNAGILFRERA